MFEELAKCETCPLRESKKLLGYVPSEVIGDPGNIEAAFIGISPAKDELRLKRPMIGITGRLGRDAIKKTGYHNYVLMNTMSCWYPEEATPRHLKQALECCRPRLEAELNHYKPNLIVTFGALPTAGILKLPGIEFPITSYEGLPQTTEYGPLLPVRQPAAVYRRQDEYPDFESALRNGRRVLEGRWFEPPKVTTTIVDKESLWNFLERLEKCPRPAIDSETTKDGFYPYKRDPDRIRCISVSLEPTEGFIITRELLDDPESHQRIGEVLSNTYGTYHNGMFDCGFMYQEGFRPKIGYDTMYAHFLIDERGYSHGLKRLAQRVLGAPPWEKELEEFLPKKNSSYDSVPDEVLFPYAARDVAYLHPLRETFESQVSAEGRGVFARLLMPCTEMFNQIRHKGLRIDVDRLMQLDSVLDSQVDELERELHQMVGYPLNPSSPPEVASYLYDVLKLPQHPQLGRTTNKKYIRQFEDVEEVAKVVEVREAKKLRGTYLVGTAKFLDYDWRIHPFTKLFGAETGRISTEDPSVMNIVKKGGVKTMYYPEEGEYFLEVDLSGGELRCYTVVTNDQKLREMILIGDQDKSQDPHNTVAREIGLRLHKTVSRGQAKTGVFGRMYGRGITAFETGFRLDRQGAVEVVGIIDNMIPTLSRYNNWVKRQILENGELVSYFGRRRRFPYVTKTSLPDALREGANFLIQSMCSDVNLFAMLHMWAVREETGATPMFPVHDSIIFSVKDPFRVLEIRQEIESYIEGLIGGTVPFLTEAKIGTNWGNTLVVEGKCDCSQRTPHFHLKSKDGLDRPYPTLEECTGFIEGLEREGRGPKEPYLLVRN